MDTSPSSPGTDKRTFTTTRFGDISFRAPEILHFPEGLLGFHLLHDYILLRDADQEPFLWLQSLEDPGLAFIVVSPFLFFPGFEIQVKSHELLSIQLRDLSQAEVLTVVTVPDDPMELTTNLRGPLVINSEQRLAKQLVLIDDRYHTKHFLLKDIPPDLAAPPPEDQSQTNVEAGRRTADEEPSE